jgi:flagellar basal-body rod protein FlgF
MPGPVQTNGMSSAAAALQMLERRQAVLANNLANASTRGFKAEMAFSRLMDNALAATDTAIDLTAGTLTETHNPFDLAVAGDGFFVVSTPNGERLVRNGSFSLNPERQLVDAKGNRVLGENGPITIPHQGRVDIDASGQIEVNGKPLTRLRVERVASGADLQHEGGTMFVPDATRQSVPNTERTVQQGFLEESNVNAMAAMTDMLSVLHRYQAAQKTLSTIDAVRGIAVTDLAKPV